MRSREIDKKVEEAINFLVLKINESGKNPKPVILHSIRVGLHLYSLNYDKNIVIAAILHDVIEDTDTRIEEVESRFGDEVAKLVKANTFDESIKDKTERYKENFERCYKTGKDALIVKAADFFDNLDYYSLASNKELENWLFNKLKYFLDNSEKILFDDYVYKKLVKKYKKLQKI